MKKFQTLEDIVSKLEKGGEKIGLMKWIAVGTAAVVAGPVILPLLAAGNCDGIDGGCGGCDD